MPSMPLQAVTRQAAKVVSLPSLDNTPESGMNRLKLGVRRTTSSISAGRSHNTSDPRGDIFLVSAPNPYPEIHSLETIRNIVTKRLGGIPPAGQIFKLERATQRYDDGEASDADGTMDSGLYESTPRTLEAGTQSYSSPSSPTRHTSDPSILCPPIPQARARAISLPLQGTPRIVVSESPCALSDVAQYREESISTHLDYSDATPFERRPVGLSPSSTELHSYLTHLRHPFTGSRERTLLAALHEMLHERTRRKADNETVKIKAESLESALLKAQQDTSRALTRAKLMEQTNQSLSAALDLARNAKTAAERKVEDSAVHCQTLETALSYANSEKQGFQDKWTMADRTRREVESSNTRLQSEVEEWKSLVSARDLKVSKLEQTISRSKHELDAKTKKREDEISKRLHTAELENGDLRSRLLLLEEECALRTRRMEDLQGLLEKAKRG